jgi:hypothetical protein
VDRLGQLDDAPVRELADDLLAKALEPGPDVAEVASTV